MNVPERSTLPGRWQKNNRVPDEQGGDEEHQQKNEEVKVVAFAGVEHGLRRDVTNVSNPAAEVH